MRGITHLKVAGNVWEYQRMICNLKLVPVLHVKKQPVIKGVVEHLPESLIVVLKHKLMLLIRNL